MERLSRFDLAVGSGDAAHHRGALLKLARVGSVADQANQIHRVADVLMAGV